MTASPNKNFYIGANGLYGPNLLLTNPYSGYDVEAGVWIQEQDRAYSFSLSGGQKFITGKTLPDAEEANPNSTSKSTETSFDISAGKWDALSQNKKGSVFLFHGKEYGIGGGWTKYSNSALGTSETFPLVTTSKRDIYSLQWWPSNKFYIMPYLGLEYSAKYTIAGMSDFEEWASSAYGLGLTYGIRFGYGNHGSERKGKKWTGQDVGFYFGTEAFDVIHSALLYSQFSKPQNQGLDYLDKTKIFGGTDGSTAASHMWAVPSLQTLQFALSGSATTQVLDYYNMAPEKYRWIGVAAEGLKAIGYGIAGAGGDVEDLPLLAASYTAVGNLSTIGINKLFKVSDKRQFLASYLLGSAALLCSNFSDKPGAEALFNAGTAMTARSTQSPSFGESDFIESTGVNYYPFIYFWGDRSGKTGAIEITKSFKDSALYTDFEMSGPWLYSGNLAHMIGNAFRDYDEKKSYTDTDMPNLLSSRIGLEKEVALGKRLEFSFGGALGTVSYITQSETEAGLSVAGKLGLKIKNCIFKGFDLGIGISAQTYVTPNHHGFGIGASLSFSFSV